MSEIKNQKGMGAVFFVILITAVSLVMVKSVGMVNLDILESTETSRKSQQLEYLSESCANQYLLKIRDDNNFRTNSDIMLIEGAECLINIQENGGEISMVVEVSQEAYNKKLLIKLEIVTGALFIKEWSFVNI